MLERLARLGHGLGYGRLPGALLMLCSWGLLLFYGTTLRQVEREHALTEFQRALDEGAEQLQRQMILHENLLFGARDVLMVTPHPQQRQLAQLGDAIRQRSPAVISVIWAPLIDAGERPVLEARGRQRYGEFAITEPAPGSGAFVTAWQPAQPRPQYAPILYAEPRAVAGASPGIDLLARPEQHASLILAAERGSGRLARIWAPAGVDGRDFAFALLAPVPQGTARTPVERRRSMRGVVALIIHPDAVLQQTLLPALGTGNHYELVEAGGEGGSDPRPELVSRTPGEWSFDDELVISRELQLGHRRWQVKAQPGQAFLDAHQSAAPAVLIVAGSAALLLLMLYLGLIRARTQALTRQLAACSGALSEVDAQLARASSIDGLTRVADRRLFDETLTREWARAARQRQPIGLICADIDYFRRYNDRYGNAAGDRALVAVAELLAQQVTRPADLVARIGGEEFALLLPGEGVDAGLVAERCRQAVVALGIAHQTSRTAPVLTVSLGVATLIPDGVLTPEILLRRADRALHQAKAEGRNRVIIHRAREWPR